MSTPQPLDLDALQQEIAGYFDIKTVNDRAYAALDDLVSAARASVSRDGAEPAPLAGAPKAPEADTAAAEQLRALCNGLEVENVDKLMEQPSVVFHALGQEMARRFKRKGVAAQSVLSALTLPGSSRP